ncbi:hypothetical protein CONCODRAFT_9323 [Conidiobolus coronatus NRRL 28638]|uniref:Uncharacterized protein n=1 Tax=Conidiobolus coronatus (strain ATCC 28846 / CBS 209.66 / NRRL 28638) TaxID=796925 RepID=A0A137P0C5_CONC2|nr:hypothetical protein CONCODRAFT_9323 [Conidiobolus coronatus NRRL 28638]|eukprot:KXN68432.1 hypothetical protein CONCODRAFT_9323 [Conidiobolus coronatus NRRL 28638]
MALEHRELYTPPSFLYATYGFAGLVLSTILILGVLAVFKREKKLQPEKTPLISEKPKFIENIADVSINIEAQYNSNFINSPASIYIPPETDFEDISILEAWPDDLDNTEPPRYSLPTSIIDNYEEIKI